MGESRRAIHDAAERQVTSHPQYDDVEVLLQLAWPRGHPEYQGYVARKPAQGSYLPL